MHDFHMAVKSERTDLIFDVVTPYGFRYSDGELTNLITQKVKTLYPDYNIIIDIDKS